MLNERQAAFVFIHHSSFSIHHFAFIANHHAVGRHQLKTASNP